MESDLISRQAALDAVRCLRDFPTAYNATLIDKAEVQTELMMLPPAQPEPFGRDHQNGDLISRHAALDACHNWDDGKDAYAYGYIVEERLQSLPPAQPEIIHCRDCIWFDPPHVEKDEKRYEYEDLPDDAFDELGTGLVNVAYGINVGGRCCRDYNCGYSEDKRVFVPENNYCGRAEGKGAKKL